MAEVHLPRSLVALFPGTPRRLEASGLTVAEVLADLDLRVPGLRNRIVDAGPVIRPHINVFVAGQRATLDSAVPADAIVHVIPAVSGGAREPRAGASMPTGAPPPLDDPRALTILTTEHWSLLSARALVYNEAFARAGMFLTFLSASLIALGLVATATGFSREFLLFAVALLALDLFIGLATLGRISSASQEDIRYLQGMARLRHAYHEVAPGVERYFVSSYHDDLAAVLAVYGRVNESAIGQVLHGFTTTPGMIGTICTAIAAVLTAISLLLLTGEVAVAVLGGVVAFGAILGAMIAFGAASVARFNSSLRAMFPTPERADDAGPR